MTIPIQRARHVFNLFVCSPKLHNRKASYVIDGHIFDPRFVSKISSAWDNQWMVNRRKSSRSLRPHFYIISPVATSHTQSVDGKQGDVSVEVPNPARDEGKARAEAAKKASILRSLPC